MRNFIKSLIVATTIMAQGCSSDTVSILGFISDSTSGITISQIGG